MSDPKVGNIVFASGGSHEAGRGWRKRGAAFGLCRKPSKALRYPDRVGRFRAYCAGLLGTERRKSIERPAAAEHQSFAGESPTRTNSRPPTRPTSPRRSPSRRATRAASASTTPTWSGGLCSTSRGLGFIVVRSCRLAGAPRSAVRLERRREVRELLNRNDLARFGIDDLF